MILKFTKFAFKPGRFIKILVFISIFSFALSSCGDDDGVADDFVEFLSLEITNIPHSFNSVSRDIKGTRPVISAHDGTTEVMLELTSDVSGVYICDPNLPADQTSLMSIKIGSKNYSSRFMGKGSGRIIIDSHIPEPPPIIKGRFDGVLFHSTEDSIVINFGKFEMKY